MAGVGLYWCKAVSPLRPSHFPSTYVLLLGIRGLQARAAFREGRTTGAVLVLQSLFRGMCVPVFPSHFSILTIL